MSLYYAGLQNPGLEATMKIGLQLLLFLFLEDLHCRFLMEMALWSISGCKELPGCSRCWLIRSGSLRATRQTADCWRLQVGKGHPCQLSTFSSPSPEARSSADLMARPALPFFYFSLLLLCKLLFCCCFAAVLLFCLYC